MMKFTMDHIKNVSTVAALIGLGYGVIASAGWIISRADAETMIQLAVQQASAQTNEALLDEVKARQRADIQFQINFATQEAVALMNIQRDAAQEFRLEQLRQHINQLNQQLAGLQ